MVTGTGIPGFIAKGSRPDRTVGPLSRPSDSRVCHTAGLPLIS